MVRVRLVVSSIAARLGMKLADVAGRPKHFKTERIAWYRKGAWIAPGNGPLAGIYFTGAFVERKRAAKLFFLKLRSCEKIDSIPSRVIPAEAGIQDLQRLVDSLDSGFHRSDG